MIYIKSFSNYEEFKELFGVREHGNGNKSRKNKILLSLYKDKNIWAHARKTGNYYPFTITSMPALKEWLMLNIQASSFSYGGCFNVELMGNVYRSNEYETDNCLGICMDGDVNAVRYIRHTEDGDRTNVKMKAGKFFRKIIDGCPFGNIIGEALKIWACEQFLLDWSAYCLEEGGDGAAYELHTGNDYEDFEGIYGDFKKRGSFGSCMDGKGFSSFYVDAVNATAAWLTDSEGYMAARCVVFNKVYDGNKEYRLAERQYALSSAEDAKLNNRLKRLLVMKLIKAGFIDGYKNIGASCWDNRAFVLNDGSPLNCELWIDCSLSNGDTLSFMDGFRYYNDYAETASNEDFCGSSDLATTNGYYGTREEDDEDDRCWSDYHQEYIDEDEACYVESRDDYFYRSECVVADEYNRYGDRVAHNEYYFEDDCVSDANGYYYAGYNAEYPDDYGLELCPYCEEWHLISDGCHSDVTDEWYCCEDCQEEAEKEWYEENGYEQSDYDELWHKKEDMIDVYEWLATVRRYVCCRISVDEFNEMAEDGGATEYCGEYYIDQLGLEAEPIHLHSDRIVA